MIRFLLLFQLALCALAGAVVWWLYGEVSALSVAAGAGTSLLNLFGLSIIWPRIFAKKQIALAIGVIVFKFAILGWILYEVVTRKYLSTSWFALGMALVIPSVVVTAFWTKEENNG